MKTLMTALLCAAAVGIAAPAFGQATRLDAIWARSTNGAPITLDGVLNEAAWSAADSKVLRYGIDNGIAGSGYQEEGGRLAKDSTYATIKFLTVGNQLYLGVVVRDSSVGGSSQYNRFDGLLMSIKDHLSLGRPAPPAEYLYSWWYQPDPMTMLPVVPDPTAPGLIPTFGGRWSTPPWGTARTQEQIDAWDAVTTVQGLSNSDAAVDIGYTVEMRFDLGVMGYDITQAAGDIVEWNLSIYDCDWFWPLVGARFSSNRAWWEGPWGNAAHYSEVRVHARPSVTVASGVAPVIGPELRVPNGSGQPNPVFDGMLSEASWGLAHSLDLRYGDDVLRDSYPGVLRWRAGQYQPPVNGAEAAVLDPGDATVKYYFKNDSLYLGFDVRDIAVQGLSQVDRWDGFIITINDRTVRFRDRNLESRRLSFHVGASGQGVPVDYLAFLEDTLQQGSRFALALKPGTTVDTTGLDTDSGYTAELMLDLTKLGYPAGLGDRTLFLGIDYLDGDSFTPFNKSYGTRTWWGREYEHECCPVWAYLDPALTLTGVDDPGATGTRFALLGSYPNPARLAATLRFSLPEPSRVSVELFDTQGRRVAQRTLGVMGPGVHNASIPTAGLPNGLYLYRIRMSDPLRGSVRALLSSKLMLLH